jgi:Cu-processing system ATP-binding protein
MSLRAEAVVIRRGRVETLHGVSLAVAPGERVALLGHNGAGKTTLIKAALGLIPLAGGALDVCGAAPGSREARMATAYLPESVAFQPALTGREQLRLFARLRGRPEAEAAALLERVGLGAAADRRIATYSKGMRQRVGLAQALLGAPRLALLDEPTSGLDPVSRGEFYALVDALAAQGAAVLISSHALTELEARTDRIAILRKGSLVADAPLAALRLEAGLPIRVRLSARPDAADGVAAAMGGARMNGVAVEFAVTPADKMAALARVAALGAAVEDVEMIPPGLDDLYRWFSRDETP